MLIFQATNLMNNTILNTILYIFLPSKGGNMQPKNTGPVFFVL